MYNFRFCLLIFTDLSNKDINKEIKVIKMIELCILLWSAVLRFRGLIFSSSIKENFQKESHWQLRHDYSILRAIKLFLSYFNARTVTCKSYYLQPVNVAIWMPNVNWMNLANYKLSCCTQTQGSLGAQVAEQGNYLQSPPKVLEQQG